MLIVEVLFAEIILRKSSVNYSKNEQMSYTITKVKKMILG